MIKTILVPASGDASDAAAFPAALAVARTFDAHLDVLHVRLDPASVALAMATEPAGGAVTGTLIERLEEDARGREATVRDSFTRFCKSAGLAMAAAPAGGTGPSAELHVESGDGAQWLVDYGMTADLIVAPRAVGEDVSARSILEAILLETGRPLLIPATAPLPAAIERVAIAWKPTAQAARAVAMAMPFLARAKQIAVLSVEEEQSGAPQPGETAAARLVRNLGWHGLTARAERLTPGREGAAATLMAGAAARADLLVMGGYGHSRLREWVFGGFTQRALADAPLPVLIAH